MLLSTSLELQWRCAWPWRHGTAPPDSPPLPKKSRRADADVRKLLAVGAEQRELVVHHVPRLAPVEKPRSTHNAASLAYIGDAVYELYVRRHFLTPPQSMDKYNASVMALVCCEAQDSLLQQLLRDKFLSDEERDVVRWGKNVVSSHRRATKRAGFAVYSGATALEALVGYLYLTDLHRLEKLMEKLGFNGSKRGSTELERLLSHEDGTVKPESIIAPGGLAMLTAEKLDALEANHGAVAMRLTLMSMRLCNPKTSALEAECDR